MRKSKKALEEKTERLRYLYHDHKWGAGLMFAALAIIFAANLFEFIEQKNTSPMFWLGFALFTNLLWFMDMIDKNRTFSPTIFGGALFFARATTASLLFAVYSLFASGYSISGIVAIAMTIVLIAACYEEKEINFLEKKLSRKGVFL